MFTDSFKSISKRDSFSNIFLQKYYWQHQKYIVNLQLFTLTSDGSRI